MKVLKTFKLIKYSIKKKGFWQLRIYAERFFCFPKFISTVWPVHYLKVNRYKHIGVEICIKNCPLNRGHCYMEVLLLQMYRMEMDIRYFLVSTPPPLKEILHTPMVLDKYLLVITEFSKIIETNYHWWMVWKTILNIIFMHLLLNYLDNYLGNL